MKTITLTDDQFDTLFEFVDQKVECIAEASYLDSEILEGTIDRYYDKIELAQSKQPDMEW